ncbi:hypothetical protein FisN_8Lh118 [Fistulifera solaris]|uniref:DUF6824 domain-containing protein n=1 Tax=Fistulifera solaris TaxID=1519565 RepID=A0A1Z5JDC8_FISSO|nr:hypothetical protein FisN_8Lh118 [Fistulifera solaris]|eukprot:GAX12020.1 hypothetical protein FisN_8Lh118 [Fistulifera solaris]
MDRQRQKRQTASTLVQKLWGKTKKKTSTAQPRPEVVIPPKGIGPVSMQEINENDVLAGRGGRINAHIGNVQFRDMVAARKKEYLAKSTRKFLKADPDGLWYDIGDQKAFKKVGQALREDAPDVRDSDEDDDIQNSYEPFVQSSNTITPKAVIQLPSERPMQDDAAFHTLPLLTESTRQPTPTTTGFRSTPPIAKAFGDLLPYAAGTSGAAAAAMQDADLARRPDEAFGRPFHHADKDTSFISGFSASDMVSDMSALTDPMSTLSARMGHQRPAIRQSNNTATSFSSTFTGTRPFLSASVAGLNRSNSWSSLFENNSLRGGGIRDSSQLAGSGISGMQSVPMSDADQRRAQRNEIHQFYQQQQFSSQQHELQQQMAPPPPQPISSYYQQSSHHGALPTDMSVASMSMNSVASIPASIMSGLSDTLQALDLAEPRIP